MSAPADRRQHILAVLDDPFVDEDTSRIWVHGDLHVENFGTYVDSDGRLVFDVDDFDEAYVGPHTWDVKRFAADGVDGELGLHLDNTDGPVLDLLEAARRSTRTGCLLAAVSHLDGARRRLSTGEKAFALDDDERARVLEAFARYLGTIPASKRVDRGVFYTVGDVVQTKGIGIGSAGLTKYTVLVEGYSQTLDDDVLLSVEQSSPRRWRTSGSATPGRCARTTRRSSTPSARRGRDRLLPRAGLTRPPSAGGRARAQRAT